MGKKNIFIRIWESVILFLKTITGIEQRDILNDQTLQIEGLKKEMQKQHQEHSQLSARQIALLARIQKKAYFPMLLNKNGKGINAALQRDFKTEIVFNPNSSTLSVDLIIDRMHFEKYDLDLDKSYAGNVNSPLFNYAKIRFEERDRNFMDECAKNFTYAIFATSFEKEVLQSDDILEILGRTILLIAKPGYVKAANLQDFEIDKGPVEKPVEEKETTNEV